MTLDQGADLDSCSRYWPRALWYSAEFWNSLKRGLLSRTRARAGGVRPMAHERVEPEMQSYPRRGTRRLTEPQDRGLRRSGVYRGRRRGCCRAEQGREGLLSAPSRSGRERRRRPEDIHTVDWVGFAPLAPPWIRRSHRIKALCLLLIQPDNLVIDKGVARVLVPAEEDGASWFLVNAFCVDG